MQRGSGTLPAMFRFVIVIVLIWAALMPPFFTGGACDAEFDVVAAELARNRSALGSPELAAAYFWRSAHIPVKITTPAACRRSKPVYVETCGAGDLLFVQVPVRHSLCRIYRDTDINIRLQYTANGRLQELQSQMKPFREVYLPWLGIDWYWGR